MHKIGDKYIHSIISFHVINVNNSHKQLSITAKLPFISNYIEEAKNLIYKEYPNVTSVHNIKVHDYTTTIRS